MDGEVYVVGKEPVTEILSSKAVRNHVLMITLIAQTKEVRYVVFFFKNQRSLYTVFNHLKFGGLLLFVGDFTLSTVFGRE